MCVCALALTVGCAHPAWTLPESLRAAESFVAPEGFSARRYYDEDGVVRPLPEGDGGARGAVRSYRFGDEAHPLRAVLAERSFVYDNALAMIANTLSGRLAEAQAIGRTLEVLSERDGAIGFSFSLEDPAFYNARYVRSGAMAWAGYALAHYDETTQQQRFRGAARRIADNLLRSRVNRPGDPRDGLVPAGRGRWSSQHQGFDPHFDAGFCVTEHQIDAYFLLQTLGALVGAPYADASERLAGRMIEALWIADEGRFAVAANEHGRVVERALDAGAWGTLFLAARGDRARAGASLAYTTRTFASQVQDLQGFAPYAGATDDHPGVDFRETLFSEGTASVAIALLRSGDRGGAERLAVTLRELQRRGDGGVLYALPERQDFPSLPSVAATAWLLFLERELLGHGAVIFGPLSAR